MKKKGFTLVELIIVVVILGILAVYSVPKLMKVDNEARKNLAKSLAKSLNSAAYMVHTIASTHGQLGGKNSVLIKGGETVETIFGYPTATKKGIVAALHDIKNNFDIEYENIFLPEMGSRTPPTVYFLVKGVPFFPDASPETIANMSNLQRNELRYMSFEELADHLELKGCFVSYSQPPDKAHTPSGMTLQPKVSIHLDGC